MNWCARASEGIEALNEKYAAARKAAATMGDSDSASAPPDNFADGNFFLFHRNRRWNAQQGVWMGWERKRGKLEQFNAALRGNSSAFDVIVGPVERLAGVRYVITLDSDTDLPRDTAHQLAGVMSHPLNRPYLRRETGADYRRIWHPSAACRHRHAQRRQVVVFTLVFRRAGIDPYTRAVSDVYQDLFCEGSFVGKGIYDVDALQQAIAGRFPENHVLSHDLLEGGYARSGLVSDVTLFEDFPSAYPADVSRRYRWIRGDWQIAPWLRSHVPSAAGHPMPNPLSAYRDLRFWTISAEVSFRLRWLTFCSPAGFSPARR